jgi:aerotaxis receptor
LVLIGAVGVVATRDSNDRTVPLAQPYEINDRMKDNSIVQYNAAAHGRAGKQVGDAAGRVAGNIEAISRGWAEYMATYLTPEERITADSFAIKRKVYVENAIKPSLVLLGERKSDELGVLLATKGAELFDAAKLNLDKLVAIQVKEAKVLHEDADRQYVIVSSFAVATLAIGLLLCAWIGFIAMRAIGRPISHLNEVMAKIEQGVFTSPVTVERDDEITLRCATCRRCSRSSVLTARSRRIPSGAWLSSARPTCTGLPMALKARSARSSRRCHRPPPSSRRPPAR